ncbi:MAG: AAA family ATPase [Rhodospirillales bacterium]|jgi:transitional endoplasmic reticulum ATPase|nr:AAA family ATPase [Rhodospirillaceae bacterium]MDP6426624.1 AAA family ATPase [Rhodospirillales bacterium]MDP6644670.1 AAA family ATPase [Rhodospirillales bacterium]MDP6842245.1 AAA family ATPase [Rhodospirillales bacterium]
MIISLSVDRLKSEFSNIASRSLVHIDPEVMDQNGLKTGDVINISTATSRRPIPARIGEPFDFDRGAGTIRLDRFLRTSTKAKMNEEVEVKRIDDLPILEMVSLMPPLDVSTAHHLNDHLRESLTDEAPPLTVGSVIYATFHGSSAGTTYKVVKTDPECGVVGPDTKILVEVPTTGMRADEGLSFEDIGGMEKEIRLLRELVQLPLQFPQVYRQLGILPPRGIIFYGPPGSGKSYLARAVANEVHAGFYYINGPDVVGTLHGETEANLRKMFAEAAHHAPSVVLIDELDAIAPHRDRAGAQSDVRMVTQLLSLLDGLLKVDGVVVIGTTNRVDAIDVALRRPGRFDREIFFAPPNATGRLDILAIHTREMPLTDAAEKHLEHVAAVTHGFVGADIMELCREAGLNALRRSSSDFLDHLAAFKFKEDLLETDAQDFDKALGVIRPSAIREAFVTIPDVTWDDIGGLEDVKELLRNTVERPLKQADSYRKIGIDSPGGVLLHGLPGTGKSLLAKAIAKECGVNFLTLDGPEIFTKWLGESEEAIRHIFRVARQLAPSIVFFDQLDALAPARGTESGSRTTERVVNQLLAELDGMRRLSGDVMVIAATNRIDLVDPSVLRPGRFGVQVNIPMPSYVDRLEIFSIELRDTDLRQASLERLAERCDRFSGADIHSVCVQAKMSALRRGEFKQMAPLVKEDFLFSIEQIAKVNAIEGGQSKRT